MTPDLPDNYLGTGNTIWSNLVGILDVEVEERLRMGGCFAQHAAWNFVGYVWFDPSTETWYEQIHVYRKHVDTLSGDSATNVIAQAMAKYGVT